MGQRSQTYIMWKRNNGGRTFIGRYHQCLYGDAFLDNCAGIIEWTKANIGYPYWYDNHPKSDDSLLRIYTVLSDVQFSKKDVAPGRNLLEEDDEDLFGVHNNDGCLYIWINYEAAVIRYCFTNGYEDKPMTAGEWYAWDTEKFKGSKIKAKTQKTIEYIEQNAVLMTAGELRDFMKYDYRREARTWKRT